MKKRLSLLVLVLGLGVSGAAAAYALAESPPPPSPSTAPTTTGASDTTPTGSSESVPTETKQTPPTKPRPKKRTTPPTKPRPKKRTKISAGVTIGDIHVGGLAYGPAYSAVSVVFRAPIVLELGDKTITVSPFALGAKPYIGPAVRRALAGRPGSRVRMVIAVHRAKVVDFVQSLAARYDHHVGDARVVLQKLHPLVLPEKEGRSVLQGQAVSAIVRALQSNARSPLEVPAKIAEPKVRADSFGPIIVIRRDSKWLYLFRNVVPDTPAKLVRRFQVATGQPIYPTPLGSYAIVDMQRNPWWYPPDSAWAKGESPVPPGPGNPLGTRWMGLSAPGVGIHGTPDPASLGYSASHGCIRMYIPSAEWLFNHVQVGTPVMIVPA